MAGSLAGSVWNIVFDYIFIFPVGLGFAGAALATAFCPIVTMSVCMVHYFGKKCHIGFKWKKMSVRHLISCCQLGVSAFVGEISSAVIAFVFNMLILGLAGSVGVAAYGIVANLSIVGMCIFNGLAQGAQPLISESFGRGESEHVRKYLRWGMNSTITIEIVMIALIWLFTDPLVAIKRIRHEPNKISLFTPSMILIKIITGSAILITNFEIGSSVSLFSTFVRTRITPARI